MVSDRALYGIGINGEERWAIELTNHISYIGVEKKEICCNSIWWSDIRQK